MKITKKELSRMFESIRPADKAVEFDQWVGRLTAIQKKYNDIYLHLGIIAAKIEILSGASKDAVAQCITKALEPEKD